MSLDKTWTDQSGVINITWTLQGSDTQAHGTGVATFTLGEDATYRNLSDPSKTLQGGTYVLDFPHDAKSATLTLKDDGEINYQEKFDKKSNSRVGISYGDWD